MKTIQVLPLLASLSLVNISYATLDKTKTPLQTQTAVINGKQYTIMLDPQSTLWIKTTQNKVVYKLNKADAHSFEVTDFNEDGTLDILVDSLTNAGDTYTLITYDKTSHAFRVIEHLNDYPNAEKLVNTPYYYSYHKSGCADSDWDSDLFYIRNFQAIRLGNISGRGCSSEEKNNTITIYKTQNDKSTLIETLPLDIIENYKGYKWEFIKSYWTKNSAKFHP